MKKGIFNSYKLLGSGFLLGTLLLQSSFAEGITLKQEGHLGAFFQGKYGGKDNTFLGLNAHLSAVFSLTNKWSIGVGAIGGWSIIPYNSAFSGNQVSQYPDRGDISDGFVQYKSSGLKVVAGRYYLNKLNYESSDFLTGPIQGLSVDYKRGGMHYFFHYINSAMRNGYRQNRIGSSMSEIVAYNPLGKGLVGGEVFNLGVEFYKSFGNLSFSIAPWVLFNTSNPYANFGSYFNPITQVGAKVKFGLKFARNIDSSIIFNGILQIANFSQSTLSDNISGLIKLESFNKIQAGRFSYNFGGGFFGVLGSEVGGNQIFTISDKMRFYGLYFNGANYFQAGVISGYLFGGLESSNKKMDIDLVGAFGTYSEFSLAGSYKIYQRFVNQKEYLGIKVGLGYGYAGIGSSGSHSIMAYGKLYY